MGKLAYPCIPCPESVISPVVRVMGCITWGLAESQVDNSMSEQAAFPACRSHSVELGEGHERVFRGGRPGVASPRDRLWKFA